MSVSTELTKLNGKIQSLEDEISAYKAGLTIQEIRNNALLTALNQHLATLLAAKEKPKPPPLPLPNKVVIYFILSAEESTEKSSCSRHWDI